MDLSEFMKRNKCNYSGSSSIIAFDVNGVAPSDSDDRMLIGITSY